MAILGAFTADMILSAIMKFSENMTEAFTYAKYTEPANRIHQDARVRQG